MRKTILKIGAILTFSLSVIILFFVVYEPDYLGDNYYYLSPDEAYDIGSSNGAIIYKSNDRFVFEYIIIEEEVVEVDYDDDYIVALQKRDSTVFHYFIINKKTDSLFGPFVQSEFKKKRDQLGLDLNLKLKPDR